MNHLGGMHRGPNLPALPDEISDPASRNLNLVGEHYNRDIESRIDALHGRLDHTYDYLLSLHEAIEANYDETAARVNELPEMSSLDFFQDNVAAGQTAVALSNGMTTRGYCACEEGSIMSIAVRSNEACTAGTLTLEVYLNGAATGLTTVLDGTNTTFNSTRQLQGADIFVAGDAIDLRITTSAGWTPTTADIIASVGIVFTGVG